MFWNISTRMSCLTNLHLPCLIRSFSKSWKCLMAIWASLSHDSKTLRLLKLAALSAKLVSSASFKEFIKVHGSHWLSYPSFFTIFWNPIKIFIYFHPQPICGQWIFAVTVLKLSVVWTLSVVLSIIVTVLHVFKYKNDDDDFLFVTYTIIQSITSSEMCSLHLTHPSAHTPGAVGGPGSS